MRLYGHIWSKYRPAILKMMIDSDAGPQTYQLYSHEFKSTSPRKKSGYDFVLQVAKSRAINNIRDNVVAQDLLDMLQYSPKANELLVDNQYEITLSRQFVLSIKKLSSSMN